MTPQEQEKDLFERWRAIRREGICPDGVHDWKTYLAAPFKIAFVLKDAYDNTGTIDPTWSVSDKRTVSHATNLMLSRWITGLNARGRLTLADANDEIAARERPSDIFSNMAHINIKKTYSPTATTDHRALVREAQDADNLALLKEQWQLYAPALTVCVVPIPFWCMRSALTNPGDEARRAINKTSNGSEYWRAPNGSLFIGTCHPAARRKVTYKYDMLMDAARELGVF